MGGTAIGVGPAPGTSPSAGQRPAERRQAFLAQLRTPVKSAELVVLAAAAGLAVLRPAGIPPVVGYVVFGATLMAFASTWLKGPKLQFLNLSILFAVILLTIDYPNPIPYVLLNVALGATLDAFLSKWRFGQWRVPWPTMVGSLGISLVVDGHGVLPFVLLPLLMVGSKHLLRWRGKHLFNPNNFAASLLLLLYLVRVGVNDWGAAPQTVFLMLLFGSIATSRVRRLDLAVSYLLLSFGVYWAIAAAQGWGLATVWQFAWSPIQVVIGFFAITDPATSPEGLAIPPAPAGSTRLQRLAWKARRWPRASADKLLWALLLVLLGVPATLAGRVEAPIFALFLGAPQRHFVTYLVRGKWPPAASHGAPRPAPAAAPAPPATGPAAAAAPAVPEGPP